MFWVPPWPTEEREIPSTGDTFSAGEPNLVVSMAKYPSVGCAGSGFASHQISFRSIGKTRHGTECDQPKSTVSWSADLQVRPKTSDFGGKYPSNLFVAVELQMKVRGVGLNAKPKQPPH